MAESRRWPALDLRSAAVDATGALADLVSAVLYDHPPLAVHDLIPPPIPPGGLWDPTAPPPPTPPPTPLAWRLCYADDVARDRAAAALAGLDDGLTIERLELDDDDWVARSQASLTAITAGPFVVAPPWDRPATVAPGTHVIIVEPSMGFGTGHHQTTRLCLAALGAIDVAGRTVLDLGTGSGVLAMAASLCGARAVRGVDIDADAIAAAERSVALNELPTPVALETADVFATPAPAAEVVLANLTGAMLIGAATALAAMTTSGGTLIVSGFMQYERDGVEAALDGFTVIARSHEDEWCAAVLRRA